MFCPGCGANNSTDQKYCRACGLNLEQSAASLLVQRPSPERADIKVAEKRLERLGNIAFGGLGVVGLAGFIGVLYAIFVGFIWNGQSVIPGIIFILLLIFAALGFTYVVLNESLKEKKLAARNPNVEPVSETPAETGKLLEDKHFEPVPSVTEGTTELLGVRRKTKELD